PDAAPGRIELRPVGTRSWEALLRMNAKEIEAKRDTLKRELWEVGHKLGLPTSEWQQARNARIAELQRQLDELPPPPEQVTGEAAGIVQIGTFLGDPWRPPPSEQDSDKFLLEADPYLRYMREVGEDWR